MKRTGLLLSIALATLLSVSTLSARGGHHGGGSFGGGGMHSGGMLSMFQDLNLTTAQTLSIQQIMLDMNYARQSNRINNPRETNLKSSITSTGFNKTLFVEGATANFTTHIDSEATYMENLFSVLTSEQITTLYNSLQ